MKVHIAWWLALSCVATPAFAQFEHKHFHKLTCNAELENATCADWDTFIGNQTEGEVKIPCGSCVTMPTDGRVMDLAGGLNVAGKLHIPEDASFTMSTPYFLVQGEVRMDPPAQDSATIPRPDGKTVKVVLTGTATDIVQFFPEQQNAMACGMDSVTMELLPCSIGSKPFAIAGGQLDIHAIDDGCPTWTKLQSLNENMTEITLANPAAAACWAPGAELLFTPDDVAASGKTQVATIASVDSSGGVITLEAPLTRRATAVDDGFGEVYAVEVALLTRRFTFEPEDNTDLIGGHTIVLHTPHVAQTISGVEFRRFGQQGNLGRYPFHFHMSESVYGSVVSKNLVRDSNQRCFVVHGTHNVTLSENIAFDTFGHCFMVEDGGEWDNWFIRNLGSKQKVPAKIIRSGESDKQPTTFWMPTPVNNYVGNVAAGSAHFGFWLEVMLREPSKSLAINKGKSPSGLPMGTFDDNVAHSNGGQGIAFYPLAYRPSKTALARNVRSYKNGISGVRVGGANRIRLEGGLVADNKGGGVETSGGHTNVVKDMTVVRRSAHQDMMLATGRSTQTPCSAGITYPNDKGAGSQFYNVRFEGYDGTDGCGARALQASHISTRHGLLLSFPIFSNLTFDSDTHRVSVCRAATNANGKNIRNIAYENDGTLTPDSGSTTGFLVQDNDPSLQTFLPEGSCSPLDDTGLTCLLSCPSACLRHVTFVTSGSAIHEGYKMVVTERGTGLSSETKRHIFKRFWGSHDIAYFGTALPGGKQYDVSWIDGSGNPAWPGYVNKILRSAPDCSPALTDAEVNLAFPPADARCDNPVYNGDMERGDYWGWTQVHSAGLKLMDDGGAEGTAHYLRSTKSGRKVSHGFINYVDTSCIRAWSGRFVRLSGYFRAFDTNLQDMASKGHVFFRIDGWTPYSNTNVAIAGDGTWAMLEVDIYLKPDKVDNAKKAYLELEGASEGHIAVDEWRIEDLGPSPHDYEVWPKGYGGCPEGYRIQTKLECELAGAKFGNLRDGAVVTGSWNHVPCGCSLSGSDPGDVHFDTNENACDDNDGNWKPVCRMMPSAAPSVSQAPTISQAPTVSSVPSLGPSASAAPSSTNIFLTACGSSDKGCSGQKEAEHKDTLHEVRCCSDTLISGWIKNSGCDVWAESDLPTCHHEQTHESAESICASVGARLCTADELLGDCTRGSGCEHDHDMIWSSDPVYPSAAPSGVPTPAPSTWSPTSSFEPTLLYDSYYTACGSTAATCKGTKEPEPVGTLHEVRCCSDTQISGWVKKTSCDVWGESDIPDCFEATHASAESICASEGARLCTADELLADCTRGSGCGHDNHMIWSSDPFVPPTSSPTATMQPTMIGAAGETGRVSISSDGVSVDMRYVYVDPVVVAFINTRNGDQSADVRVKDVTSRSFRLFLEEAPHLDGWHGAEDVSYIVMEAGRHVLEGGLVVEAGRQVTSSVHAAPDPFTGDQIDFAAPFDATPVVVTTLNTHNNGAFMSSLATGVLTTGFKISQEALQTGVTAMTETIGWMAFSTGSGTTSGDSPYISSYDPDDGVENGVGQTPYAIDLTPANFAELPDLVVGLDEDDGFDGAYARGAGVFTATAQTIYAEEDQQTDSERNHASVPVAWVGFGHNSDLFACGGPQEPCGSGIECCSGECHGDGNCL